MMCLFSRTGKRLALAFGFLLLLSIFGCGGSQSSNTSAASTVDDNQVSAPENEELEVVSPDEPVEQEKLEPEEPVEQKPAPVKQEELSAQHEGPDEEQAIGSAKVETDLYDLMIPSSWQSLVNIEKRDGEYNDYTLGFYHNASASAGVGGHLFSICMYPDDSYKDLPAYKYMGRLVFKQAEPYEIVVIYPTDVQFTDATSSEYQLLKADIESVIQSFTPKSVYPFYPSGS